MKTTVHETAVVSHTAATVHTAITQQNVSIGHTVEHAATDAAKPTTATTSPDLHLPAVDSHRAPPPSSDHSPTDSAKTDTHGFAQSSTSLDQYKLPTAAVREQLLDSNHKDPVQHNDAGNWLSTHSSSADLRAGAGVSYGTHDAATNNQSAAANLIAHEQAAREQAGSAVGKWLNDANDKDTTTTVKDSDGNTHLHVSHFSDNGIIVNKSYLLNTDDDAGIKLEYTATINLNNHTDTYVYADGSTKTYLDGKLIDSTKALQDPPQSDFHVEPLTQPSHTPDTDHAASLPELDEMLRHLDVVHHNSHDGTTTNSAGDDIPGTVTDVSATGPFGGHPINVGPADPEGPSSGITTEGQINGAPGQVNQHSGNGNVIHDLDQGSQSTGPEERNTQHDIRHDAPAAANAAPEHTTTSAVGSNLLNTHDDVFIFNAPPAHDPSHLQLGAIDHPNLTGLPVHDLDLHLGEDLHAPVEHSLIPVQHETLAEHHPTVPEHLGLH